MYNNQHYNNRVIKTSNQEYGNFTGTTRNLKPNISTVQNKPYYSKYHPEQGAEFVDEIGLPNLGQTCYLNSVFQILNRLNYVRSILTVKRITAHHNERQKNKMGYQGGVEISLYSHNILKYLRDADKENLKEDINGIRKTLNAPEFANNNEHDSQEFLKRLQYAISSDLNEVKVATSFHENRKDIGEKDLFNYYCLWTQDEKRREESLINKYFEGDMLIEMMCKTCGYVKYSFEKFSELVLDLNELTSINKTHKDSHQVPYKNSLQIGFSNNKGTSYSGDFKDLEKLIENYFKVEQIEDFKCSSCKRKCTIEKRSMIWTFPYTLFVYLKRFELYPKVSKKMDKVMIPSSKLNLMKHKQTIKSDREMLTNVPKWADERAFNFGEYNLVGYIEHHGKINSGHYIAFVDNGNTWNLYNDEKVSKIKAIDREDPFSTGSSEIYILAYEIALPTKKF